MTIASPAITVTRRLLDALLLALVVVSLGVVVLGRVVPFLGHPTFVVAGPSMGTSIPMGAAVVLEQVPSASLAVGDVVSLRSGAGRAVFTHRVIRLAERDGGSWLETQGDANATPDPSLTPATAVIGRVAVSIPLAGYLLTLYSVPSGILFVISLGLVLLLLGVLLEPSGVQRSETPLEPEDLGASEPAFIPTFEPATVKEIIVASRERRARRSRWGPQGSQRPEPGA
jgi:signal peptidase I